MKNMLNKIVIRMSGGLGNQMFQYALYVKLRALGRGAAFDDETEYAAKRTTDVVGNSRPKMLSVFGITYPRASKEDIISLTDADLHLTSRIRRKLTGRKSKEVQDKDFIFDKTFWDCEEGYLTGCFQSAKYFAGEEDAVQKAFTFPENIAEGFPETQRYAKEILEKSIGISQGGTCAVHLRFGDYLDKSSVYGGICTTAYYDAAVDYVRVRFPHTHFFVFSNDSEKAAAWCAGREGFTVVTGNDEAHGYLDLYLMQLCDHFIIANSSFSWWGSWLGRCSEKIIVAPTYWINMQDGSELKRTDIFTEEMVRISPQGVVAKAGDTTPGTHLKMNHSGSSAPLVSVIVAAYNIEDYIGRALESLERQTLRDIEIVAVDDGSTDRTGAIIDAHAAKDPRIKVVHKANGGLSDARNAGLSVCTGQYIGYLDGDDLAEPQMYEAMVRGCIEAAAPLSIVRFRQVTAKDVMTEGTSLQHSDKTEGRGKNSRSIDDILRTSVLLKGCEAMDVYLTSSLSDDSGEEVVFYNSVWSKLFARSLVEDLTFPVGKNSEDIMYTTKALQQAERVVYIGTSLYDYVQDRPGSIMNVKLGERRLRDELPFWEEQIRYLTKEGNAPMAQKATYYFYRRLLYYYDDFAADQEFAPYRDELEQKMRAQKDAMKAAAAAAHYARRGDRARLRLFAISPAAYRFAAKAYATLRGAR